MVSIEWQWYEDSPWMSLPTFPMRYFSLGSHIYIDVSSHLVFVLPILSPNQIHAFTKQADHCYDGTIG